MAQFDDHQQYIVTARKWRPQRFADVVGQEHVTRTLRNAVQSSRIHHAYIFNGPRGVGKTTTARILAKAVNCENPSVDFEPCNTCASCTEINTGRSLDVIEIDGASNNSVDDIRKLRENAKYPPMKGAYKMYIIDEVHMLSTSAFNALLKILEEPPRHLLFVFATTEPHKVPATILSRCQRFDFRRMQVDEIAAQLRHIATQEGISIDDESLAVIGKKGDGSMRDSQSIFDQVLAFCGKTVEYTRVNEALNLIDQEFYFTLGKAIREHDVAKILDIAREVFMRGYDLQECLNGFAEHFRNILTVLATGDARLIEAAKVHREQYIKEAAYFKQADVLQFMSIIITTEQQLRFAPQPRLRFEFALVQMAKMDSAVQITELLEELAALKKKLKSGELSGLVVQNSGRAHNYAIAAIPSPAAPSDQVPSTQVPSDQVPSTQVPSNQAPSNQPLLPPRFLSAAELHEQWKAVVSESETIDAAIKTYLLSPEIIAVQCHDNALTVSATHGFIADKFIDKKAHLENFFSTALNGTITVNIIGGTTVNSAGLFGEYVAHNGSFGTLTDDENSADEEQNTFDKQMLSNQTIPTAQNRTTVQASAVQASPVQSSAKTVTELPPLDKAIIELFGAVEVPLR